MARDLHGWLVGNVLFPLQERAKGHWTVGVRRSLEQTQWLSAEHLQTLQLARLRALLTAAGRDVRYYRELFDRLSFDPASVRGIADLAQIPFLTKALIRANQEALKSRAARHLARSNTGGSSGEPLIFFLGRERVTHDVAAKWRATRWWDVDIGDREAVVWGSPIEINSQDRIRALRDWSFRTTLLPAFEMSDRRLDEFVEFIASKRPAMLFGYPSALAKIATHAERRGRSMLGAGVKVAFVTSERLYDDQRETISRVFGCRVANGYGGRDAGFIAHECPSGGMHITAEDVIVEIVDPAGHPLPTGHAGEIVITHLASADFPFIRYRTGDVATLTERSCPCGRGLPMLENIQGRTTDFVVAQNGTVMHGLALIYVVRDIPGIESFKIVQETAGHTRVFVVRGPGYAEADAARIRDGLQARLGAGVTIDVVTVDTLPREASGKHRYVVSRVTAADTAGVAEHA
jgi:phenylacetate-CoA ligase